VNFSKTVVLGLLALAMSGCNRAPEKAPAGGRILALASILPLADFARQVGGDRVTVEALVPPGASPHTYELLPSQLRSVSHARLLVLNGVGLEFWADRVIAAADNPDLLVVRTSEGLALIAGDPDEPGGNPHVWLSPRCAMHQVRMIRDGLIRTDPSGTAVYEANARNYIHQLSLLDDEVRAQVATFSSRRFIAFHAAWAYLARDYGLDEAGVIEHRPGQEPSPEEIAAIVRSVRSIRARAIFAEPQFSPKAAEAIAEETGTQVLFLNPLGSPPDYDYLDMMRANLKVMAQALK
jgi:ABC-type Zn uptake system ZnuABC Zn-binding protein ZnuA